MGDFNLSSPKTKRLFGNNKYQHSQCSKYLPTQFYVSVRLTIVVPEIRIYTFCSNTKFQK